MNAATIVCATLSFKVNNSQLCEGIISTFAANQTKMILKEVY